MLIKLQALVNAKVELFIGGHYIQGTITGVDASARLFIFTDDSDTWTVSVDSVDMVKEIL